MMRALKIGLLVVGALVVISLLTLRVTGGTSQISASAGSHPADAEIESRLDLTERVTPLRT